MTPHKKLAADLIRQLPAVTSMADLLALFRDRLDWPIPEDLYLDELTFDWNAGDLRISDEAGRKLAGGVIRQLRPLPGGPPWGIFIIEFAEDKIHRTALREILRGLVPNRRRRADLQAWRHDDLLFLCTTRQASRFTIVHFHGEQAARAKLAGFTWEPGSPWLRTVCEFNLPALAWLDGAPDAAAWRQAWAAAFDKEPLTDAFFKRFQTVLEAVKADLEQFQVPKPDSARAYSQAQLLLERLVFLYFLQNRGWLNQQRDFLIANFAPHRGNPEEFSYYQQFLDVLFFSLATPPNFSGAGAGVRMPGIPFLNGGLFDDDEFARTTVRFNPPLRIRNATFAFIFAELLEAFNFTVREDTPLSQDVAVDPEMLGKVFESIVLHAEAADDDAVAPDKRKATGSYYTPRIVVHFICREALRQYLLTHLPGDGWPARLETLFAADAAEGLDADDLEQLRAAFAPEHGRQLLERLRAIKACDPSVGSGAFPVGLLHELVNLRRLAQTIANGFVDPVRKDGQRWLQDTKADIIENGLYGVDIQQQAIEICQLRLWLSLVMDYDLGCDPFQADRGQFLEAIRAISQLPNLEMNFRRGDSLLDMISGVPIRLDTGVVQQFRGEVDAIQALGHDLHQARKGARKRELRLDILHRRLAFTRKVLETERANLKNALAGNEEGLLGAMGMVESDSAAQNRRRLESEDARLAEAVAKLDTDARDLAKLARRQADPDFFAKLRKLEGADFNSPFNFAWQIDLAEIFHPYGPRATLSGQGVLPVTAAGQQEFTVGHARASGFDLILGNPPFVTARNPVKRELYRERWKRVCSGKYLLICPFFDLSFNLLRPGGQLGFIVSNAFAKREFGKPLVEDFFPTVDVQKIVDCSGLMFPGHGTPTCIVFGRNAKPDGKTPIRVTATLPGGGDLRTQPEQSPLWQAIEEQHDHPGYADTRITVTDRPRKEMHKWPWNFDADAEATRNMFQGDTGLASFVDSVGVSFFTNADEIFLMPSSLARRFSLPHNQLVPCQVGDEIRNWNAITSEYVLKPYDGKWNSLPLDKYPPIKKWLMAFRKPLGSRATFEGPTYDEAGQLWYGYHIINKSKLISPFNLTFAFVATHGHFVVQTTPKLFKQTAPIIKLPPNTDESAHQCLAAVLNSSAALFLLKQTCFNKNAGEDEERDRFEFSGGKIEQFLIPTLIAIALRGNPNPLSSRLTTLSQACWERGRQMPALALKKLFEMPDEAYQAWNDQLPGHTAPDPRLGKPFATARELRNAFDRTCELREILRAEMIALQEEMDWLVYAAYGLIGRDECRIPDDKWPEPLRREQRPFVLWQQADGDFDQAVARIPADWAEERKKLWRSRLECIRDNEHVRRIEQPVYKRRWDEQWKVGNRWDCGPLAYAAEFAEAFDGWLSEKAEHWLENRPGATAVTLEEWTLALWQDNRVRAAWQARQEIGAAGVAGSGDEDVAGLEARRPVLPGVDTRPPMEEAAGKFFTKHFRDLVNGQTVPDGIPWGVPWEELAARGVEVPEKTKKIRGKLNVPRERFHLTADKRYHWAGRTV